MSLCLGPDRGRNPARVALAFCRDPGSGSGSRRQGRVFRWARAEHIAFSGQGPTVRRAHAGAERAAASAAGAHAVAEGAAAAARRCFRDPSGLPPRALSGALLARWAGACG